MKPRRAKAVRHKWTPQDELVFGDVAPGWTPLRWASELRRKADACQQDHPDIADNYRRWANHIDPQ